MHTNPRTVSPRRSRRTATAARALALVASVSLLACEEGERAGTPRDDKTVTPRTGEPSPSEIDSEPGKRPESSAMGSPTREQEPIAGRTPPSEQEPSSVTPGTTPGLTPGTTREGGAMGGLSSQMQTIEKTASLSLRDFESKLESELGNQDLTLASSFDLKGQEQMQMRMFVVAPKDLSEAVETGTEGQMGAGGMVPPREGEMQHGGAGMPPSGEMPPPSEGGGMQPGGAAGSQGMQQPSGMGGSAHAGAIGSKHAEAALQKSRLVVAYTDKDRPGELNIAYLSPKQPSAMIPGQPDQKLHAAIDSIVGEAQAPSAGTEEPKPGV